MLVSYGYHRNAPRETHINYWHYATFIIAYVAIRLRLAYIFVDTRWLDTCKRAFFFQMFSIYFGVTVLATDNSNVRNTITCTFGVLLVIHFAFISTCHSFGSFWNPLLFHCVVKGNSMATLVKAKVEKRLCLKASLFRLLPTADSSDVVQNVSAVDRQDFTT